MYKYTELMESNPETRELFKNICISYISHMHRKAGRFDRLTRDKPVKNNVYRMYIISTIAFMFDIGLIDCDEIQDFVNTYVEDTGKE